MIKERYRTYCYIHRLLSNTFPVNHESIPYGQAYWEYVFKKGICRHAIKFYNAETYCPECSQIIVNLDERYRRDLNARIEGGELQQ
jgi:Mn-dependent DtxR family transcriptional regulator